MSGSLEQEKIYPKTEEDIENEKEIIDEIKKITDLPLKLKAFALNHHTLKLKETGTLEEQEIDKINYESQKSFEKNLPNINDIVTGGRKPTPQELGDLSQYFTAEELQKQDELLANIKPIEEYWLTVLKNDSVIKSFVTTDDEKALKHLIKAEYKLSEDPLTQYNFTVTLYFTPNDYFSNEVLSVDFHMKEVRDVTKTEATTIEWKEGKNFTKKQVTKKQKNKKTGQTRTVTKEEDVPSFFNLFKSLVAPEDEDEEDEEASEITNQILDQVDIGYSLMEEAIPFSLEYFLGVRKDFGDDEEDFEDDDDEDDDDDEEEEAPKKGKKAAKGKDAQAADGQAKQECKQQ